MKNDERNRRKILQRREDEGVLREQGSAGRGIFGVRLHTALRALGGGTVLALGGTVLAGSLLAGCGMRGEELSASGYFELGDFFTLEGALVVRDRGLDRLLFVRAPKLDSLEVTSHGIGKNVEEGGIVVAPDQKRLFVLDRGGDAPEKEDNERPSLAIFSGGTRDAEPTRVEMDAPMNQLVLDARSEWLAAYQADAYVTSDAEFLFLSLSEENLSSEEPRFVPKTIRRFGAKIEGVEFSDELTLPSGKTRFFAVRSRADLTLVDLSDLDAEEVTIKLPTDRNNDPLPPVELAFDDGDEEDPFDARVGIRLEGSSDVVLLTLGAPRNEGEAYAVDVNIVDVGGVPSEIEFVRTDGGLRLAALVPSAQVAMLVDPATTLSERVELDAPYSHMTKITDSVPTLPDGGDVALLWGESQRFAFWSLGSTSGTPYASVHSTALDFAVSQVLSVPDPDGTKNGHLKILVGAGGTFFVLDLRSREATMLTTKSPTMRVMPSRDGERIWVTPGSGGVFSFVTLTNLHPEEVRVSPAMNYLADIERRGGGRAALAVHGDFAGLAVTVFDGENPKSTESRHYPFLSLEALR